MLKNFLISDRKIIGVIIILVLVGTVLSVFLPTQVDIVWRIHEAQTILDGGKLYIDLVGFQFPHYIYTFVPPVALANWLNLNPADAVLVFVGLLGLGAMLAAYSVLTILFKDEDKLLKNLLLFALAVYAFIVMAFMFGQKSHLLILFASPYIFSLVARARGISLSVPLAILIGFMAAYGFAIKPFYLLVPLFLEFYLLLKIRRGIFRPELYVMAASAALYALAVAIFRPEFFTLLDIARRIYGYYVPIDKLFNRYLWQSIVPMALFVVALFRPVKQMKHKTLYHFYYCARGLYG